KKLDYRVQFPAEEKTGEEGQKENGDLGIEQIHDKAPEKQSKGGSGSTPITFQKDVVPTSVHLIGQIEEVAGPQQFYPKEKGVTARDDLGHPKGHQGRMYQAANHQAKGYGKARSASRGNALGEHKDIVRSRGNCQGQGSQYKSDQYRVFH